MFKVTSSKGTGEFETAEDFGEWLEEMQPSHVTVEVDGIELDERDLAAAGAEVDGVWDAAAAATAVRRALA